MKQLGSRKKLGAALTAALSVSVLSMGGHAFAADANNTADEHTLGETVVTATRTPNKELKTDANITVITGKDIERRHYTDLTQALRDVPVLRSMSMHRRDITTAANSTSTGRNMWSF